MQRSPTGLAVSLYLLASVSMCDAMVGSATTATDSSPSTQRAAAASLRLDSMSPKNRHRMTAATTTTTVTSATMTPTLTPRLPPATARWLPVHSPPSHSPVCCGPVGVDGGGPPAALNFAVGASRSSS